MRMICIFTEDEDLTIGKVYDVDPHHYDYSTEHSNSIGILINDSGIGIICSYSSFEPVDDNRNKKITTIINL